MQSSDAERKDCVGSIYMSCRLMRARPEEVSGCAACDSCDSP